MHFPPFFYTPFNHFFPPTCYLAIFLPPNRKIQLIYCVRQGRPDAPGDGPCDRGGEQGQEGQQHQGHHGPQTTWL